MKEQTLTAAVGGLSAGILIGVCVAAFAFCPLSDMSEDFKCGYYLGYGSVVSESIYMPSNYALELAYFMKNDPDSDFTLGLRTGASCGLQDQIDGTYSLRQAKAHHDPKVIP